MIGQVLEEKTERVRFEVPERDPGTGADVARHRRDLGLQVGER